MEWKCYIFDSTAEDKNNCIGELFSFCGRHLLDLLP